MILVAQHSNISLHVPHAVLNAFPEVPEGSQSRASLVDNHFLYSCDLNVWFKGVIVGKNKMRATPRSWRGKELRR